jgi:hypothetical protein
VGVPVEGELHRCVSQRLLDVSRVGAASQEEGCVGVPEIVPPYVGQPRPLEKRLEAAVHYILSVKRGTFARGENEVRVFV